MDAASPLRVDRRPCLNQRELLIEYVERNKPVIITEPAKERPAVGKWPPQFFKENYPNVTTEVRGEKIRFAEQVDRSVAFTCENPAPYPYNLEVEDYFPELMKDLSPQFVFGKSDRGTSALMPRMLLHGTPIHEVFSGGNGSAFPLFANAKPYRETLHQRETIYFPCGW